MPTKEILNSYTLTELKRFVSQSNIKGYSKFKSANKSELIDLMLKPEHKDRFHHIKMKEKKEKPKKEVKPKSQPKTKAKKEVKAKEQPKPKAKKELKPKEQPKIKKDEQKQQAMTAAEYFERGLQAITFAPKSGKSLEDEYAYLLDDDDDDLNPI